MGVVEQELVKEVLDHFREEGVPPAPSPLDPALAEVRGKLRTAFGIWEPNFLRSMQAGREAEAVKSMGITFSARFWKRIAANVSEE